MDTKAYFALSDNHVSGRLVKEGKPVIVHLITNFTDGPLQKLLRGVGLSEGLVPIIQAVPYGQYAFYLHNSQSELYTEPADVSFIFFDALPYSPSPFVGAGDDHFKEVFAGIEHYVTEAKGPVIMNTFPLPYHTPYGNLAEEHGLVQQLKIYNEALHALAKKSNNFFVLDTQRLLSFYGEKHARDMRGAHAFDMPFTNDFLLFVCREWLPYLLQIAGKGKKCIVVDLDNTLWGGVVGEVGPLGISLGPDYPGRAFLAFQRALLACFSRGMILAINSKNNEADVMEVFEKNQHMILQKHHFASMKINWEHKADNIAAIATELNLGKESFIFIDDDPVHREFVRLQFPEVLVPEFSLPPEEYASALLSLPVFTQFRLTDEDKEKGRMYAEERERKQVETTTTNVEEYIAKLELKEIIHINDQALVPRLAQLTQKTNQFNATTRRYTEQQVVSFMEKGWVYASEVKDKFGDYGVTVMAIVVRDTERSEVAHLDSFLMSCRVMGRGVEGAFVRAVLTHLQEQGVKTLQALFIPTAKNAPVKVLFTQFPFVRCGDDEEGGVCYTLSITDALALNTGHGGIDVTFH